MKFTWWCNCEKHLKFQHLYLLHDTITSLASLTTHPHCHCPSAYFIGHASYVLDQTRAWEKSYSGDFHLRASCGFTHMLNQTIMTVTYITYHSINVLKSRIASENFSDRWTFCINPKTPLLSCVFHQLQQFCTVSSIWSSLPHDADSIIINSNGFISTKHISVV